MYRESPQGTLFYATNDALSDKDFRSLVKRVYRTIGWAASPKCCQRLQVLADGDGAGGKGHER